MEFYELAKALRAMKVETGSLVCLGCRYENNCGIKGCAILVQAASAIDILPKTVCSLTKGLCGVWQECDRLRADQKKLLEAYDAMSRDLEARTAQVRRLQEELQRVK